MTCTSHQHQSFHFRLPDKTLILKQFWQDSTSDKKKFKEFRCTDLRINDIKQWKKIINKRKTYDPVHNTEPSKPPAVHTWPPHTTRTIHTDFAAAPSLHSLPGTELYDNCVSDSPPRRNYHWMMSGNLMGLKQINSFMNPFRLFFL